MPNTKNQSKPASSAWFVRTRGSYLPCSPAGWLTYVPFIGYLVSVCVTSMSHTDSIALALLLIVPNCVAAAAVMTYIAARRS